MIVLLHTPSLYRTIPWAGLLFYFWSPSHCDLMTLEFRIGTQLWLSLEFFSLTDYLLKKNWFSASNMTFLYSLELCNLKPSSPTNFEIDAVEYIFGQDWSYIMRKSFCVLEGRFTKLELLRNCQKESQRETAWAWEVVLLHINFGKTDGNCSIASLLQV